MPHVINEGISIRYKVEGNGLPLVLSHGFIDSSETGATLPLCSRNSASSLWTLEATGKAINRTIPNRMRQKSLHLNITAVLDDLGIKRASYWEYSQGG